MGNNWYPDCQTVYNDCIALYIDTVLQTASNFSSVPLWPVSPSVGWASGVDTATGLPNGPLVENDAGQTSKSRPNQGALDVHGPYGSPHAPHSLLHGEGAVLFHSEFGELSLPQFETMVEVLPEPEMWDVSSDAQKQRSPNGAGKRTINFIEGTLGPNLADYTAATEDGYRRVAYLSQLAQSEAMRAVVDGGRLGVAASNGRSGLSDRPWGYMFWQLNDVTQGYSWGSLEYQGRLKLIQYRSRSWFAPVRVECNVLDTHSVLTQPDDSPTAAGPTALAARPATKVAQCTFRKDIDFAGGGKDGVPSEDPADCCQKCQADEQCMAATWVPKSCWMKFSADQPVPLPSSHNGTGCITGKIPKPVPQSIVCAAANDSPVVRGARFFLPYHLAIP